MTDQANGVNGTEKANGADKAGAHANGALNGASHDAVPAKAAPVRPFAERAPDAAALPLDGYRSFGQGVASGSTAKLQGTTRVVNAFIGYATNVLGRQADQLTEADVACLGGMLAALDRLEQAPRGRFAS